MIMTFFHLISVGLYLVGYFVAACVACLNDSHREMRPIYIILVVGCLLHAVVVVAQEIKSRSTRSPRGE